MARQKIDLLPILKRYKARVIRVTPRDDHFLVETTRGPMELRIWPRLDVMHWSYAWREHMADFSIHEVERFIRTRDNKPFVVSGKRGFTLTRHLEQPESFLPSREYTPVSGVMVANMHEAQQLNPQFLAADLLAREQEAVMMEVKRAHHLREAFTAKSIRLSERDQWVASLFSPLLQRMERSAELLSGIEMDEERLGVSHRILSSKNWGVVEENLFLHGFYRPSLSVQYRDVAVYLRELCVETGEVERIDAFLDGYETVKPLSYGEFKLLLGFLAFPREVWKSIHQYVTSRLSGEDASLGDDVESALQQQTLVDQMMMQIAHRAEQVRSGGRL